MDKNCITCLFEPEWIDYSGNCKKEGVWILVENETPHVIHSYDEYDTPVMDEVEECYHWESKQTDQQ